MRTGSPPPYDDANAEEKEGSASFAVKALEGLIRRIAEGRAIIYVGAGVSQSAGLPSWEKLLGNVQKAAQGRIDNQDKVAQDYFKKLKGRSRNLEIGDWLLTLLGPEFQQLISESLSQGEELCQIEPSTIHWNLTRFPFSMAITTNYDLLLETAYDMSYQICRPKLSYLTWKHTGDILRASNRKSFRIVHAHGTVGDSNSLVLSGSQYALLHNAQPRFGDVLKWLLKSKTFLFVGAGLEDPDLIFQLQEAVAEHGDAVGPHYALLPFNEAPQIRRDILRRSLNIEVISVGQEQDVSRDPQNWITQSTSAILLGLSGRVAVRRLAHAPPPFPTSDDPNFCLDSSLRTLLRYAIDFSGSYRGDICLSPDSISSHLSGELRYLITEGPTGGGTTGQKVAYNSICGIAYYQSTAESGVYVRNVNTPDLAGEISDTSGLGHYGKIVYVRGNDKVQSELALPIEADGVRVGVLNLESNLIGAYSPDHIQVARRFAEKAGRLCAAADERDRRGKRLRAPVIEGAYSEMWKICVRLWRIAEGQSLWRGQRAIQCEALPESFTFLVYSADHRTGQLISQRPVKMMPRDPPTREEVSGNSATVTEESKNNRLRPVVLDGKTYLADYRPLTPEGATAPTAGSSDKPPLGYVDRQHFPFHSAKNKDCHLSTRVFLDGRPYFYPDYLDAVRAGKIENPLSKDLGLTLHLQELQNPDKAKGDREDEPIIGFPILVHGHVAGAFIGWNDRCAPPPAPPAKGVDVLDGRHIELFRRASHLMANNFDWSWTSREKGIESAQQETSADSVESDPPVNLWKNGVSKVNRILDCFDPPVEGEIVGQADDLNPVGKFYKDRLGLPVLRFLRTLKEQEAEFAAVMESRIRQMPAHWPARPTDWVPCNRCRCWVRSGPVSAAEGYQQKKPTFFLAFQVDLTEASPVWKNLYNGPTDPSQVWGDKAAHTKRGIAMEPLTTLEFNEGLHNPERRDPPSDELPIQYFEENRPQVQNQDVWIFKNNPHFSFLLSRVSVYPFSFQQRPRVIDNDVMANVLEKDPSLPWFVAPLIVGTKSLWREPFGAQDSQPAQTNQSEVQGHLAGYLTFDDKKRPRPSQTSRTEIEGDWAKFQNDILHQMALFGSCLAQQNCFKFLVNESD